jgi:hypothetical protein
MVADARLGDDGHLPAQPEAGTLLPDRAEQTGAHEDRVGPGAKVDGDGAHASGYRGAKK